MAQTLGVRSRHGLQSYIEQHYGDDGCMVADHCTECPLRCCVLEETSALYEWQIERLLQGETNASRAARRLGVSRRTVHRWKKLVREVSHA